MYIFILSEIIIWIDAFFLQIGHVFCIGIPLRFTWGSLAASGSDFPRQLGSWGQSALFFLVTKRVPLCWKMDENGDLANWRYLKWWFHQQPWWLNRGTKKDFTSNRGDFNNKKWGFDKEKWCGYMMIYVDIPCVCIYTYIQLNTGVSLVRMGCIVGIWRRIDGMSMFNQHWPRKTCFFQQQKWCFFFYWGLNP